MNDEQKREQRARLWNGLVSTEAKAAVIATLQLEHPDWTPSQVCTFARGRVTVISDQWLELGGQ